MMDSPTRSAQTRLTPCPIASCGERGAIASPSSTIRPPVAGTTPNSARPIGFLARASQADKSNDLACVQLAVDGADRIDHKAIEFEPRRALAFRRPAENLRRLAADDEQNRFVGRRFLHDAFARDASVAQNDHPVGDLEHFVQPMRNVDHADAAIAQATQGDEQPHHFVGGQARGRLVEHENLGVGRQRAGDRDEGLLGSAEALNSQTRVDVGAELFQCGDGASVRRLPIDQAATPGNPSVRQMFSATVIQSIRPRS